MIWINIREKLPDIGSYIYFLDNYYMEAELTIRYGKVYAGKLNIPYVIVRRGDDEENDLRYSFFDCGNINSYLFDPEKHLGTYSYMYIAGWCYAENDIEVSDSLRVLNEEESEQYFIKIPGYKEYINKINSDRALRDINNRFILMEEMHPPYINDLYVTITKNATYLLIWQGKIPWIAPNGEQVTQWLKIPQNPTLGIRHLIPMRYN